MAALVGYGIVAMAPLAMAVSGYGERGRHQNRRVGANTAQLSFTGTELYRFEVSIGHNANF